MSVIVSVSVSGLVTPRIVKSPSTSKVLGLVRTNRLERKRDERILLGTEEIVAPELAVLHRASGIYAGGLNLDVQNACRRIKGSECQGSVPAVESTRDGHRGIHGELNGAGCSINPVNGYSGERLRVSYGRE